MTMKGTGLNGLCSGKDRVKGCTQPCNGSGARPLFAGQPATPAVCTDRTYTLFRSRVTTSSLLALFGPVSAGWCWTVGAEDSPRRW